MLLLRGFSALLCALAAALVLTGTAVGAEPPRVLAVEFENDVNPVTADYLTGAIEQGEKCGLDHRAPMSTKAVLPVAEPRRIRKLEVLKEVADLKGGLKLAAEHVA